MYRFARIRQLRDSGDGRDDARSGESAFDLAEHSKYAYIRLRTFSGSAVQLHVTAGALVPENTAISGPSVLTNALIVC